MRAIYAFIGAIIGVIVDLAINLLAAVIQARTPEEQFRQAKHVQSNQPG